MKWIMILKYVPSVSLVKDRVLYESYCNRQEQHKIMIIVLRKIEGSGIRKVTPFDRPLVRRFGYFLSTLPPIYIVSHLYSSTL